MTDPSGARSAGSFRLVTLMLVIAVVGVGLGIAMRVPALGLPLILFATAALGRTARHTQEQRRAGAHVDTWSQVSKFLETMGALAVLTVSGVIAFLVVCMPLGQATGFLGPGSLILALVSGTIASLGTIRVLRRLMTGPADLAPKPPEPPASPPQPPD